MSLKKLLCICTEGVAAALLGGVAWARIARRFGKLDDGRQEAGERLARAGRGDEQGVDAVIGGIEHRQLVPPRRPVACREPIGDDGWQVGQSYFLQVVGNRGTASWV